MSGLCAFPTVLSLTALKISSSCYSDGRCDWPTHPPRLTFLCIRFSESRVTTIAIQCDGHHSLAFNWGSPFINFMVPKPEFSIVFAWLASKRTIHHMHEILCLQ